MNETKVCDVCKRREFIPSAKHPTTCDWCRARSHMLTKEEMGKKIEMRKIKDRKRKLYGL